MLSDKLIYDVFPACRFDEAKLLTKDDLLINVDLDDNDMEFIVNLFNELFKIVILDGKYTFFERDKMYDMKKKSFINKTRRDTIIDMMHSQNRYFSDISVNAELNKPISFYTIYELKFIPENGMLIYREETSSYNINDPPDNILSIIYLGYIDKPESKNIFTFFSNRNPYINYKERALSFYSNELKKFKYNRL